MTRTTSRLGQSLILGVLALMAVLFAGCGASSKSTSSAVGNSTDLAFVSDMIPHHQSAIAMARIAQAEGNHPQIKTLADNIIASQSSEISVMSKIRDDLSESVTKGSLGLPAGMAGMSMSADMLKGTNPFDQHFMDMMVPHHQGAIRMARIELAKGKSPALKQIANGIIAAQAKEIGEMNRWRTMWFGKPSPSGGVPAV